MEVGEDTTGWSLMLFKGRFPAVVAVLNSLPPRQAGH